MQISRIRADRANGTAKTLNVSERRVSVDIVFPLRTAREYASLVEH
jgi:hypothetical protein